MDIRTSEVLRTQSVMCSDLRIVCLKAGRVVPTWSPDGAHDLPQRSMAWT